MTVISGRLQITRHARHEGSMGSQHHKLEDCKHSQEMEMHFSNFFRSQLWVLCIFLRMRDKHGRKPQYKNIVEAKVLV